MELKPTRARCSDGDIWLLSICFPARASGGPSHSNDSHNPLRPIIGPNFFPKAWLGPSHWMLFHRIHSRRQVQHITVLADILSRLFALVIRPGSLAPQKAWSVEAIDVNVKTLPHTLTPERSYQRLAGLTIEESS